MGGRLDTFCNPGNDFIFDQDVMVFQGFSPHHINHPCVSYQQWSINLVRQASGEVLVILVLRFIRKNFQFCKNAFIALLQTHEKEIIAQEVLQKTNILPLELRNKWSESIKLR